MKELIHQQKGDYILWKIDEEYSLLYLRNNVRKKEKEYKLSDAEREKYYARGLEFIRELVRKQQ